MAGQTPLPMKFQIPSTPVEVLSKTIDKEIMEKYLVNSNKAKMSTSLPHMDPSVIDLQVLLESEEELQKFGSLLNSWGCLQLVNHGIPSSKLDEVFQLCKEFFELPLEEKQKIARVPGRIEGWGGDTMTQTFNWNDRLILRIFPIGNRNYEKWPKESLPKFREIAEEYGSELSRIRTIVFKAISMYLKLEEDNLLNKYATDNNAVGAIRFNCYPPCPHPDKVNGLKPHSDVHLLTFLLPDKEVEGLHVEKDGQWYIVPIVPDALVVNVADMLEILSNGRIKSVFHRAVIHEEKERMSIAFGFGPPRNTEIGPMKELITEETPQLYKSDPDYVNTAADHYALDARAIDTLKIPRTPTIENAISNLAI